jgi:hypothetical protein
LLFHAVLPARTLFTWANLYTQQLQSEQEDGQFRPSWSIWLLAKN